MQLHIHYLCIQNPKSIGNNAKQHAKHINVQSQKKPNIPHLQKKYIIMTPSAKTDQFIICRLVVNVSEHAILNIVQYANSRA